MTSNISTITLDDAAFTASLDKLESKMENMSSQISATMNTCMSSLKSSLENAATSISTSIGSITQSMQMMIPALLNINNIIASWDIAAKMQETATATDASSFSFQTLLSDVSSGIGDVNDILKGTMDLKENITAFGETFKMLKPAIDLVKSSISGLFTFITNNPVTIVIAAVVAALLFLWNNCEGFRQFCYALIDGIASFLSNFVSNIVTFFTETIPQAWESFKTNMVILGETISQIFSDLWNNIVSFFTETIPAWIESALAWFSELPYNIGYFLGQLLAFFVQLGIDLWNFVTVDIPGFINEFVAWFSSLPGKIWEWLCVVINNIVQWGINFVQEGNQRAENFVNTIVDFIKGLPDKIWTWLCEVVNNIAAWGSNLLNEGITQASNFINSVVETIQSLPGKVIDIGKNIIKGIWDGICSMGDWILDRIKEFCSGMVDGFLDFFGIHSPSRLMRDMIGKFLPSGIAVGFELAMPDAEKDILSSTDAMFGKMQKEVDLQSQQLADGIMLEQNAEISKQTAVINQFPKSFTLSGNTMQPVYLVLDNGTELAHAIVEPLNKELALAR